MVCFVAARYSKGGEHVRIDWRIFLPVVFILTMMLIGGILNGAQLQWAVLEFSILGVGAEVIFTGYAVYLETGGKSLNLKGHSSLWYAALYSIAPLYYHLTLPHLAQLGWGQYVVHGVGLTFFEALGNQTVWWITGDHPSRESYSKSRWH